MPPKRKSAPKGVSNPKPSKSKKDGAISEVRKYEEPIAIPGIRDAIMSIAKPLFEPGELKIKNSTEIISVNCSACNVPLATVTRKQDKSSITDSKIEWHYHPFEIVFIRASRETSKLAALGLKRGDIISALCRKCVCIGREVCDPVLS